MEFVSVVAHASEGAGGKGFVRPGFLKECGVAHAFGEGRIGRGPRKSEGRFAPEERKG